jgi:hypothetical protein
MAVDALSTEGVGTQTPPQIAPPRSRRRRRILALTLLFIGALLIGSASYLTNYMPMAPANGTSGGDVSHRNLGSFLSPFGEQFSAEEYTYRRGARFWFAFGLRNEGPLGVRITGIDSGLPLPKDFDGLAQQSSVWIASSRSWFGPPRDAESEAFHPFWLGAGQERWVAIEIQFRDCPPGGVEGGTLTQYVRSANLTYRVLGLPRHGFMPFQTVIHLTGPPPDPACSED